MILPSECLENLKCSICHQILSLFPIYVTKNEENQLLSICGRCQVPDDDKYLRNEIYETVVKKILFPCINREFGCMEDLLPEDVEEHESQCCYQLEKCGFSQKNTCKWEGRFNELLDHYKTEHNHLILDNNKFEIEMNKNYDKQNILQYQNEMFIFEYSFDQNSNHLKCSIIPLGLDERTKQYYGQISLKSDKCTLIHDFPEIDFNENNLKSIDINIETIPNIDNKIVLATIKISSDYEQLKLNYDTKQHQELSTIMKCHICTEILFLPIYQCGKGHYICWRCEKVCCGNTRQNVSQSLKGILKFIYHQCQYGCEFIGSTYTLETHYTLCLNKPSYCLLKSKYGCKWRDCRKNLTQHILDEHKENIIKVNDYVTFKTDLESDYSILFLKFSGVLFKLHIQYEYPYFLWTVEGIDLKESNYNYNFEISMFNDRYNTQMIITEVCGVLQFEHDYSENLENCIRLDKHLTRDYLIDKTLTFKINILK